MTGFTPVSVLMLLAFLLSIGYVTYDAYRDIKMAIIEKVFWIIVAFLLSYIGLLAYIIVVKGLDKRILKKRREEEALQ